MVTTNTTNTTTDNQQVKDANAKSNTGLGIGTVAVIVAIIAIVLGVLAYNRNNEPDAEDVVVENTQETINEIQDDASREMTEEEVADARANTEARLMVLRDELESGQVTSTTVEELQELRTELNDAYQNSDDEVKELVATIDENLERLEVQFMSNTSEALANLNQIILSLQDERLSDNE